MIVTKLLMLNSPDFNSINFYIFYFYYGLTIIWTFNTLFHTYYIYVYLWYIKMRDTNRRVLVLNIPNDIINTQLNIIILLSFYVQSLAKNRRQISYVNIYTYILFSVFVWNKIWEGTDWGELFCKLLCFYAPRTARKHKSGMQLLGF